MLHPFPPDPTLETCFVGLGGMEVFGMGPPSANITVLEWSPAPITLSAECKHRVERPWEEHRETSERLAGIPRYLPRAGGQSGPAQSPTEARVFASPAGLQMYWLIVHTAGTDNRFQLHSLPQENHPPPALTQAPTNTKAT
ncbi:hypothetical protein JZ751_011663 [Albula glossodonta]|uniref:Uncharacterized protein n=1 Tax=Albula glossodonta TaxID=121402 RepID=A0A8T2PQB0_9TELE|nr:hypothetical protein JZ751_011663 [Albula glossodonta]